MKRLILPLLFLSMAAASFSFVSRGCAQASLNLVYGSQGVEQLSYKGIGLEDL